MNEVYVNIATEEVSGLFQLIWVSVLLSVLVFCLTVYIVEKLHFGSGRIGMNSEISTDSIIVGGLVTWIALGILLFVYDLWPA